MLPKAPLLVQFSGRFVECYIEIKPDNKGAKRVTEVDKKISPAKGEDETRRGEERREERKLKVRKQKCTLKRSAQYQLKARPSGSTTNLGPL